MQKKYHCSCRRVFFANFSKIFSFSDLRSLNINVLTQDAEINS